MTEYIELGISPCEESCVQVSKHGDYMPAMRSEAIRYKSMLENRFPEVPGHFGIKTCPHDLGSYLEVRYAFDSDSEDGWDSADYVESNLPSTWDDTDTVCRMSDPKPIGILAAMVARHELTGSWA